jgi:hypothetical protein
MNFGDGNRYINRDGQCRHARKQTEKNKDAAEKFGERGEVSRPSWQSETRYELNVMMKTAEDLLISVADHDRAQGEAHDKQREGLQAIGVAQDFPPAAN